jgi:hypothetical protein
MSVSGATQHADATATNASSSLLPRTTTTTKSNLPMYGPAYYISATQPTPELSLRCLQLLSIPAPRRL